MRHLAGSSFLLALAVLAASCNRPSEAPAPQREPAEVYVSDPNSVAFDIEPLAIEGDSSAWLASYAAGGKLARFRLEFGPEPPEMTVDKTEAVSSRGQIVPEEGSDSSILLADLAKALEAKKIPKNPRRTKVLAFEFVNLGEHESQAHDGNGGFFDDAHGNWMLHKVFLGKEGDCAIFINLNPVMRKGQISMKDEDYGNCAIAELAKVL